MSWGEAGACARIRCGDIMAPADHETLPVANIGPCHHHWWTLYIQGVPKKGQKIAEILGIPKLSLLVLIALPPSMKYIFATKQKKFTFGG